MAWDVRAYRKSVAGTMSAFMMHKVCSMCAYALCACVVLDMMTTLL
ncbi:MAG TPA: hypothetical protein DEF41_10860 [Desulfovibrio sp.]|uniref:Lipoprotein, putative n=1 Tax=Nitratidesulfovibrio vulgaris (strain ATCC 29579 / DSM 644 / CCUG 34227 / NCIMB 8303 / VKM B-1760 / Hildenborough) TaxID=882 RepID=Q729P9_NITV2|nr:lipoprotein, putative [Nitratidesulfovibrio vulgaris str. Hildenborough]HBW16605.1 hypothetical protein [Desulfovibrio sp.]